MSEYFPKPKTFRGNIKIELDMRISFMTKADSKNATGADISKFDKEADLAKFKN